MPAYGLPHNFEAEFPDVADCKFYGRNGINFRKGEKARTRRVWKKIARTHSKWDIAAALADYYADLYDGIEF